MFILSSRLLHERELRQRGVEQGRLLCDFQSAGDAAAVALVDQIEPFPLNRYRFLDYLVLGVEFAQGKVVGGKFGGQNQLRVSEIGRGRLQGCVRRFQVASHAPEKINLVAERER